MSGNVSRTPVRTPRRANRGAATAGSALLAPTSAGLPADNLPPFVMLTTEEERERKAEVSAPGSFHVILNPTSFQDLSEYVESIDPGQASSKSLQHESTAAPIHDGASSDNVPDDLPVGGGVEFVIVSWTEESTRRPANDLRPTVSPLMSNRSAIDPRTSLTVPVVQSRDGAALRQFRDVVWKQLMPSEFDRDLSTILLDEAAKQFPPVSRKFRELWPT